MPQLEIANSIWSLQHVFFCHRGGVPDDHEIGVGETFYLPVRGDGSNAETATVIFYGVDTWVVVVQ